MFRLRLLSPAVTLIVGMIMLSIPWIMPFARPHERAGVFVVAGVVELVLGGTLPMSSSSSRWTTPTFPNARVGGSPPVPERHA